VKCRRGPATVSGIPNARSEHHWQNCREGERRGPEPGDDSSSRHVFGPSGEGLVAFEAFSKGALIVAAFSQENAFFCALMP
jgi:hypothetical protein